tara:strand:+ start:210 stop:1169 length:960 start_codon:yes stop_codon:yes gene_type:complete
MGIYKTIKSRGPWFTFFFTLFFGPMFGMMYVNRGWWTLFYIAFTITLALALMGIESAFDAATFTMIDIGSTLTFYVIGALHATYLAYHFNKYEDLKWFSKIIPPITVGLTLFISTALIGRTFFYEPFYIPSGSMEPTFSPNDFIFMKKSAYGYSQYAVLFEIKLWDGRIWNKAPERGDAVVFALPSDPSIDYFKRVIGLPGDVIEMKQGELYINNQKVERTKAEPYQLTDKIVLDQYIETLPNGKTHSILNKTDHERLDNTPPFTVPDQHYFMMGDNRDYSQDSRVFGAVHEKYLIGRASIQTRDGRTGAYTFRNVEGY